MENNNQKVEHKPVYILRDFMAYEILILYVVLQIGNFMLELDNDILVRYLPMGLVGLTASYFILKKQIKKCKKTEKDTVKKMVLVGPVLVAVILFLYGTYSVSSNMPEAEAIMKNELGTYIELYSSIYGEEAGNELWAEVYLELDNIEKQARMKWVISSVTYLVTAGFVALLSTRRLDEWLKDEEVVLETEENLVLDTALSVENVVENENVEKEETPLNNIRWDL